MAGVPAGVEMRLGGAWVDVTSDVRVESGIRVTHGRRAEGRVSDPTTVEFTVNNRDGKYSPRNPTGPYYGQLGRNTPARAFLTRTGQCWLELYKDTSGAGTATTPDSAGLSITGDLDIAIEVDGAPDVEVRKLTTITSAVSYRFSRNLGQGFSGLLRLQWSTTGTSVTHSVFSTVPIPHRDGVIAYRATLDVDNGAGGHTVTFYYGTAIGSWTQLGDPVVGSGTTSIADTASAVTVGHRWSEAEGNPNTVQCSRVRKVQIRQGIGGTLRANADFTAATVGAGTYNDGTNTWTINSPARLTNREIRGAGEISEFPPKWNLPGTDVWVPLIAAGVTRRYGQAGDLGSTLLAWGKRMALNYPGLLTGYWPLEDGPNSTSYANALAGGSPLSVTGGAPSPASVDPGSTIGSDPVASFAAAAVSSTVPLPTTGTAFTVGALVTVPTGGTAVGAELLRWTTAGTAANWWLEWEAAGTVRLRVTTSSGTPLLSTTISAGLLGTTRYLKVEATQNGGNIDYALAANLGGSGAVLGSFAATITAPATVSVGAALTITGDVGIGHVVTANTNGALRSRNFDSALVRYNGDAVLDRLSKLVWDAQGAVTGDLGSRHPIELGYMPDGTLLDLLRLAEATDGGILNDSLDAPGALRYLARNALYPDLNGMSPAVSVDYSLKQVSPPLDPTDDDANTRNDVTVTRIPAGSSARAVATTGPLNSNPYPTGIGLYDETVQLNAYTDTQLPNLARWLLSLGTVDETRYPQLAVDLVTTPALDAGVSRVRPGSWITLANLPAWMAPRSVDLIVLGWAEELTYASRRVTLVCAPATPWKVAVLDSTTYGRLDSTTTVTNEVLDTTETGVDFTGDTWTTSAGQFPFGLTVGGEVMTATANANATTGPFTVTRSANGVVKGHATAQPLSLSAPVRLAL